MPNCKSFPVTEAERKHVRRGAQFQQLETRAVIKLLFLARQGAEGNSETLGEHAPSYATVKNWVNQFKRGDFSTCDAPHPGRHQTVTTLDSID